MTLNAEQAVFMDQVEELLSDAGTSVLELGFPFLAWSDRGVSAEWIVEKATACVASEEAA